MSTRSSKRKLENHSEDSATKSTEETSKYFVSKENIDFEKKFWLMKSEVNFLKTN